MERGEGERTLFLAFANPVFFRSTILGSLFNNFALFNTFSTSTFPFSCIHNPFATPKATAPLCPDVPPPLTSAKILYAPRTPVSLRGRRIRSRSVGMGK